MWQVVNFDKKPAITFTPQNYDYSYPCELSILGCQVSFDPPEKIHWMSHSIAHFNTYTPPLKSVCIFCDVIFRTQDDPRDCWRKRLLHIASHYENLERFEKPRPDYFLLDYLRKINLLGEEDYRYAIEFSERPPVEGLTDYGFQSFETRLKNERTERQEHDLQMERRQIRKERRKWKEGSSRNSETSQRLGTSL